jgi:hypothetical protein
MPAKKPLKSEVDDQFLFVNTDAGSESSNLLRQRKSQVSVRERRHSALRSVENQRNERQRALRQGSTAQPPVGWALTPSSLLGNRRRYSEADKERDDNEISRIDPDGLQRQRQLFQSGRDLKNGFFSRLPQAICFHNDAVDPFNASALGVDRWTHYVVQYYVYKLTPDCFIAESRPSKPQPEQFSTAITARIRSCLSSELHMYSLMASCSSRMRRFERVVIENRRNSPEYYVAKAVTALRAQLAKNPTAIDTPTFLDIASLCSAETYMGNHGTAAIHLALIKRLIRDMGGTKKFAPFLLEFFSIIDQNLALDANSLPTLPPDWIEWDQDSFLAQRMAGVIENAINESSLPSLEPGTLPGWDAEFFSLDLFTIVNDLAVYLQAAQYIWNQPHSIPGDRKWIFLRGSGILHRLLILKKGSAAPSPHPEIEECCRIALLILIHAVMCHIRARQFMKIWAPRFKDALIRSYSPHNNTPASDGRKVWLERPSIFLWVLNAGLYVSEDTDEEAWFVNEAANAATKVSVDARTAYARFLEAFFFLDEERRQELLELSTLVERRQRWRIVEQIVSRT